MAHPDKATDRQTETIMETVVEEILCLLWALLVHHQCRKALLTRIGKKLILPLMLLMLPITIEVGITLVWQILGSTLMRLIR